MNIKQFISYQSLFQIDRIVLSQLDKAIAFLGAGLLVLGIVFKIAAVYAPTPVDAKYRNRLFKALFTTGLFELGWFAARYELVSFFGSHFVAYLILLVGLVWTAVVIISMLKNYGGQKGTWEKEQLRAKYLPR